jgi:3-isopropylmalate dehydrogenase
MLLRYSLDRPADADRIDQAVERTLAAGFRTQDIHTAGTTLVGTTAMADRVIRELEALYR